ncbi:MAG: hypothetical protein GTO18_03505 [Anaerolineales bacterium]|nr:hypothetical protein [Anaerolineales bacterium]
MSKALQASLIMIGIIVVSATLILVGMNIARLRWVSPWGWKGFVSPQIDTETSAAISNPYGGMMGSYTQEGYENAPFSYMNSGMMSGYGMMEGYAMTGGTGMMGGFANSSLLGIEPVSLADAEASIMKYLDLIQEDNLDIGEIMIFDNHAYAQIVEVDTGIGALEVLVDPVTLAVSPEPGPNMMWNLKYSPMSGFGEFGMMWMMGTFGIQTSESMDEMMGNGTEQEISVDLQLAPEEAVEVAQRFLDVYIPGAEADEHVAPFYGYYTVHILRNSETVGMLSVNGYTRQVFLHSWHGDLLDVAEHE